MSSSSRVRVHPPSFFNNLFMISDIKLLFRNYQGYDHPHFHNFIKEYVREFHLDVIGLFETRVSVQKADLVISKLGFPNSFHV